MPTTNSPKHTGPHVRHAAKAEMQCNATVAYLKQLGCHLPEASFVDWLRVMQSVGHLLLQRLHLTSRQSATTQPKLSPSMALPIIRA